MPVRITVDIGGTCTDLVVSGVGDQITVGKALTTFDTPEGGLWEALSDAARQLELAPEELLAQTELFVYSTTRATNAILEGTTSRTALLVTEGFRDLLVRKEGGRLRPYDFATPFPKPYIPRHLTFEVPERIAATGAVVRPLTEPAADAVVAQIARAGVEAVAIALVWSIVNPEHEELLAHRIQAGLPEIAVSVSHRLNPVIREFRRASSVSLDASLKPLMQRHLKAIEDWLRSVGYHGRLVAATSLGGVLFFEDIIERPIYLAKSGPALAPMAGLAYSAAEVGPDVKDGHDIVVCDTGGTSFDVSLVRGGRPVVTRETWLGETHTGHLTGLASLDVRSVGAGGGSIARIAAGGLLQVGPRSAGSDPGPACYGLGGVEPTVTDAAAVLGYLDAESFLGGRVRLNIAAAHDAVGKLGEQIGLNPTRTAAAILTVAGERMADAIREITINQGVDPREAVIVAGGGAAGMTIVPIIEAIGCSRVLIPPTAGALSAAGAHFSDVLREFTRSYPTTSAAFDHAGVLAAKRELDARARAFGDRLDGTGVIGFEWDYVVEARYAEQIWDLEVPFDDELLNAPDVERQLRSAFDAEHHRIFTVSDPTETVEFLAWKIRARGILHHPDIVAAPPTRPAPGRRRAAVFDDHTVDTPVLDRGDLTPGQSTAGPLLVQLATTTIVVPPRWTLQISDRGSFILSKENS
ncbi:hydantoinase/oxoprolinase family protein [Mycolicibacterium komossense]|uniref:Hydantoinase/oxoprolinase family protein n=1 Tax=Mycolicibacterium komossense TaxID=1779 RepID=A0ABT3C9K7_9MYCO|nr:hydantoinase/oxoprolinase family protein [Mycolicibacterium komossense]MCV7226162.1 hydantoinase/oxoprolinase family protein [Mycolicibacterium komossense]